MAIVRFRPFNTTVTPFRDLTEMQSEMNRLFDGFFGRDTAGPAMERVWAPAADMVENKDELVITVEVPGVSQKDIHLSIDGDLLTVKGERRWSHEDKQEHHYRLDRWAGKFERVLPLPVPVQADKVRASYRDGVLTVTMPKVEEIKPKEIAIDVA
jgi:HSP20 family protein